MGFDENRLIDKVDDELRCSVCHDILEDPTISQCEHLFCKLYINEWLEKESSCPIDRKHLRSSQLCSSDRFFRNFYSRLKLKCIFETNGCHNICRIEDLESHQNKCQFSPLSELDCDKGCGASMVRNKASNHNCVEYLKKIIENLMEEKEGLIRRESENEEVITILQTSLATKFDEINALNQKIKSLSINI
jgi:hypothetical protein